VASSSSSSANVPVFTFTIASNAPAYYQNINPQLTGEALKQALDLLISTNVSVSYDWYRFETADESMTETNKVLTIYPRRNYLKTAHVNGNAANTWNREHTYPQSKISGAAVNDNHHIYADDWKTNSTRGNYKFGIVSKSDSTRVRDSSNTVTDNYVGGGFFEPNDAAKGEVARATLYMNTYYGYTLTDNFQTAEMAVLWALQYPPTDRDMQRNNRVYTNQGNRNPYVDAAANICGVYGQTSLATRQACGLA
jgi:endonuclease I